VPGGVGAAGAPTETQIPLTEGIGSSLEEGRYYTLERKFHHVPTSRIRYVSERRKRQHPVHIENPIRLLDACTYKISP
jgi:hypothetical protein